MAKSRTRKKSAKPQVPPTVREITNAATAYIKHWTNHELGKLQNAHTPICIPTKYGYRIGTYTLNVQKNKSCELIDVNREFVHTFDNKINAILYTIYTIKNNYRKADEIIALDKEINKHSTDIMAMKRSQQHAKSKKDYEIVDIRQARLEIAQKQLEIAHNKISKIRLNAKYNKVWE
jgi:hypothetical protein